MGHSNYGSRPPGGHEQKVEDWPPDDRVAGRDADYYCKKCGGVVSKFCYRCTECGRDLTNDEKPTTGHHE